MILSAREKILLFLLALVLVIAGGTKFLVNPTVDRLVARRSELAQMQSRRQSASQNVRDAGSVPAGVQSALTKADSSASALLPSVASDQLNAWFLKLAQQNGLTLVSIQFDNPVATDIHSAGTSSRTNVSAASQPKDDDIAYQLRMYAEEYRGTSSSTSRASSSQTASARSGAAGSTSSQTSAASASSSAQPQLLERTATLGLSGPQSGILGFLDAIKQSGRTVRVVVYESTLPGGTATVTVQCFGAEKPDDSDSLLH